MQHQQRMKNPKTDSEIYSEESQAHIILDRFFSTLTAQMKVNFE